MDVLVFPELGLDPVTYFLSFAKLAIVQARRSTSCTSTHPDLSASVKEHVELISARRFCIRPSYAATTLISF